MALMILRTRDSSKNIKITKTHDGLPVDYVYMNRATLKEVVFWARWYKNDSDANKALGCDLKPGEVAHVG